MAKCGDIYSILGLYICVCFCFMNCLSRQHQSTTSSCSSTQQNFVALNLGSEHLVPNAPMHDAEMEICYHGDRDITDTSCCTRKMEKKFHLTSEKDFYTVMRSTSSYLKNLLITNVSQYKEYFVTLMQTARNRTEVLLTDVHNIPLADRHGLLNDLYLDLQAYIQRRDVDIHESSNRFFNELFPLVFHNVLSDPSSTTMTPTYRECLMRVHNQLFPSPFGEVPRRFAHGLHRSLTAAKTLLDALNLGVEVVNTTDYMPLESQCTRSLTKLQYCSVCRGLMTSSEDGGATIRPCRNYCTNVMRGCMALFSKVDPHWNTYVDTVRQLTLYMHGEHDLERVMLRAHTDVSEAIMHAMETGHKYYHKIRNMCGPGISAQMSSHNTGEDNSISLGERADRTINTAGSERVRNEPQLAPRLDTLMRSLLASKGFYHNLADTICSAEKYATGMDQQNCWNGHTLSRYNKTVIPMDAAQQIQSNPEMRVLGTQRATIATINDKLDHIVKHLQDKISDEMMQSDGWGSQRSRFSGGSGDGRIDDEDYDFSGSGSGAGDYNRYIVKKYPSGSKGNKFPETVEPIYFDSSEDVPYITSRPDTGLQQAGQNGAPGYTHTSRDIVLWTTLFSLITLMALRLNG